MSWVHSGEKVGEGSPPPLRGSTPGSSSGAVARAPVRLLALLGLVLVGYGAISVYERFLASRFAPASENLVIVSIGGVTGPDIVSTRANPAQPQAPSPFRFTEIAQQAGIEFVHFSGMTKDKHFPTANGSGVAVFDYDNDGKLDLYFATGTLLPAGKCSQRAQPALQERGGQSLSRRDRGVGPGFRGLLPRHRGRRHRQRWRPGRLPLQLRPKRALPQQRRTVRSRTLPRHAGVGGFELVHRWGFPRLRQRWRPRSLRDQLWSLEAPGRRPVLHDKPRPESSERDEVPYLLLTHHRSSRPDTSSTGTTATGPSRTSPKPPASAGPTAEDSGWSRQT